MADSDVDCSYTDENGTFHESKCAGSTAFCCIGGDAKYCSTTSCGLASTNTLASYAFWLILAGVAVCGVLLLLITYAICRYRKPDPVTGQMRSIFEESMSHTAIGRRFSRRLSSRPNVPDFRMQVDALRQGGGNPITVRSGNSAMQTTSESQSRWTVMNHFNARHQSNRRTDSKEEILKSKDGLPDVQG